MYMYVAKTKSFGVGRDTSDPYTRDHHDQRTTCQSEKDRLTETIRRTGLLGSGSAGKRL